MPGRRGWPRCLKWVCCQISIDRNPLSFLSGRPRDLATQLTLLYSAVCCDVSVAYCRYAPDLFQQSLPYGNNRRLD